MVDTFNLSNVCINQLRKNVCGVKKARMKGQRESGEESRASSIDLLLLEVAVTIIKVPVLALINSTWDINIDRALVAYNSLWSQMIFFEKF